MPLNSAVTQNTKSATKAVKRPAFTPTEPQFDPHWNVQSVIFKVEGILFSVLKHGFLVKGTQFETMFSMPPSDPKNVEGSRHDIPIVLEDTAAADFRAFLRVLYPQDAGSVKRYADWLGVLRLAHKWEFVAIREEAIWAIDSRYMHCTAPQEKIQLGNKFLVKDWLMQGYVDIAMRDDLKIRELEEAPFFFDQTSITKFFYIQSKLWKKQSKREFGTGKITKSTAIQSFVRDQVKDLFRQEIKRAEYAPQVEPEALPPQGSLRKKRRVYVESSDSTSSHN